jgi:hypothetical protein
MAVAFVKQLEVLKKTFVQQIDKLIASHSTVAPAAGEDAEDEPETVKLTPLQKKQAELAKLLEKIEGGKSKIPDKDQEKKAKLEEDIQKLEAKEAEKAKPKPAKAAAKKVAEAAETSETKVELNIPRITPAITTNLKKAFEEVGVEWLDDKKKTYGDGFKAYANALSDKEYEKLTAEGHMSFYANSLKPSEAAPAAAGGGPMKVLTVNELAKLDKSKKLVQVSAGVFKHKTTGELLMGPAEDDEEEFEDFEFDDEKYIVGTNTHRVYKTGEGLPDKFVGFRDEEGKGIGSW